MKKTELCRLGMHHFYTGIPLEEGPFLSGEARESWRRGWQEARDYKTGFDEVAVTQSVSKAFKKGQQAKVFVMRTVFDLS
jgi:ribosome modulation factor